MSNETGGAIIGGCCSLFVTASLQAFCNTRTYGGGGCCGGNTAGCCQCGSCCDDSFNEDSFDKHMAKSGAELAISQPIATEEMTTPVSSGGDVKGT